jgi:hypothetical protein
VSTGQMRRGSSWFELSREGLSVVIRANVERACRVAFVLHHIIAVVRGVLNVVPDPHCRAQLFLSSSIARPSIEPMAVFATTPLRPEINSAANWRKK